jgi:hypothetical protein
MGTKITFEEKDIIKHIIYSTVDFRYVESQKEQEKVQNIKYF